MHGVIFDLDGTLADTLQDITDATNAALRWAGLPSCEPRQVRRYVGSGVGALVRRASGREDPKRIAELEGVLRDHYAQHALDHTRLYDGVAELLDALTTAGVPMCVLSNKPQVYTVMTVEGLMSAWRFVEVLGESDRFGRKPDPAGARRLVESMGLRPEEVVMVGDSEVDVETAGNAGLRMVGVTWGFRDRADLEPAGANEIIDRPAQLLGLLGVGT